MAGALRALISDASLFSKTITTTCAGDGTSRGAPPAPSAKAPASRTAKRVTFPRRRDGAAKAAEPARQEDRLAAVPAEESFGRRQHALAEAAHDVVPLQEATAELAAEPVTDVVADDRRCGRDDDHGPDREMPLRREHGGGDERRLAGKRQTRRLEADREEDDDQPVVADEPGHAEKFRST